MKNRILAIPEAVPAIPPNPKTAATNAMMRNIIEYLNILVPP